MARKYDRQVRPVTVKALKDCELHTHTLKKGQVTEIQSDHVDEFVEKGLIEVVKEKAVRGEGAEVEKR